MLARSAIIIGLIAQLAWVSAHAQEFSSGRSCAEFRLDLKDVIELTRLCSESAHRRRDAPGADAACRAAGNLVIATRDDLEKRNQLPAAEREECAPSKDLEHTLAAIGFIEAFLQFRQTGGPIPAAFALH